MNSARVLNGWKDIAEYLGKSVRSVQRWEITIGLPVRRRPADEGAAVFAHADEIDAWRRALDPDRLTEQEEVAPPVPSYADAISRDQLVWIVGAAAIAIAVGVGLLVGRFESRPVPVAVDFRAAGQRLEALSSAGEILWSYSFETEVSIVPYVEIRVGDLDGDGEADVTVPLRFGTPGSMPTTSDAVYTFSRAGKLKWTVRPSVTLSFGQQTFAGPWMVSDLVVSKSSPPRRTWLVFSRPYSLPSVVGLEPRWPGFVIEVDGSGTSRLRYAQPGAIGAVAQWMTAAGNFIAIAGSSEEHHQASLVLLGDDDAPATFGDFDSSHEFACQGCPSGAPRRILLMPPTELTKADPQLTPFFAIAMQLGAQLSLQLRELGGSAIVELNQDFTLRSIRFADRHWVNHGFLEREGRLNHTALNCPERHSPMVLREWTAADGWRDISITPDVPDRD